MQYDGTLRFNTKIDEAGFNKGTAKLSKGISSISKSLGTIGLAMGVAQITGAVINLGKQAINLASDLQEVQNVVDVSFGSMKQKIEDFADTSIEKFGMSELTAKKTASTYMAIAKAMNINTDRASDMAISLTALTGDMSSFYNVSQSIADTALKSIFTGETESLKQFGIVMTVANLEAFAFAQGITKSYSAMSEAEKVQLRYAYVMKTTALAQGDFTRTQDGWANQTRVLTENFKSLLSLWGQYLMVILLPVVKFLNLIITGLIDVYTWLGKIFTMVTGKKFLPQTSKASGAMDNMSDSALGASDAQGELANSIKDTGNAIKGQLANFDELDVLQSGSGGIGGGFGGLGGGLSDIIADTVEAKDGTQNLKKEMEDFFFMFEDRSTRLRQEMLVPIRVPAPVFEPIKNPVWAPNWGLQGVPTKIPAPVFEPIPNPVYNPVWNIIESLMPELETAKQKFAEWVPQMEAEFGYLQNGMSAQARAISSDVQLRFGEFQTISAQKMTEWQEDTQRKTAETSVNVGVNTEELARSITTNYGTWGESTKSILDAWKKDSTGKVQIASENMLTNTNAFMEASNENLANWANSTGSTYATWGTGMTEISHDTSYNIVSEIVGGLKIVWQKFKESLGAMGKSVSGSFDGSFNLPTMGVIGAGALGIMGGMNLLKGNFIPALANGAVIPPNSEFLAILGDQKSGRNIEAPEGLIRDIVREEVANMPQPQISISASANEGALIRYLKFEIDKETNRVGKSLVGGLA